MSPSDRHPAGPATSRYLEHLSSDDLGLLSGFHSSRPDALDELRSNPARIEGLLSHAGVFHAVFGEQGREEPFLRASPFLVFALVVHRCAAELRETAFVSEWLGPRQRVPVFDVDSLRDFLGETDRRLFLAELLASYTHVSSGSLLVQTRRGWRRRRFSELDPLRLASLLEVVPEEERAGIYRRLGDLALFLTGVFPDHTATRGLSQVTEARLRRSAGLAAPDEPGAGNRAAPVSVSGAVALMEALGRRWYRLACSSAPVPTQAMDVVSDVSGRFDHARRILNLVTERHLFPFRSRWMSGS